MLTGSYTFKIDDKGRVFVPAKFRDEMGESFVILMDGDSGCLAAYSAVHWAKITQNIENAPRSERMKIRDVLRFSDEVTPDKMGRITINSDLRKLAGLELKSEVVFVGMMINFEIWSKDKLPQPTTFGLPDDIGF